ncbi:alpha/beta-hydrolase [Clavulina sp. PMI_390]|nr:alpha/beta-hydrolase [Clavulina sp. PMI_390]
MPYVNLTQSEVQLYWTSCVSPVLLAPSPVQISTDPLTLCTGNIPGDNLRLLRSDPKPLVVFLHPALLSSDWREPQLSDPTLNETCYMIAIDGPNARRSSCPNYLAHEYPLKHDTWAEAGMLALFAQALDLPPFHIFAEQTVACDMSKKFAILFPRQCLSITLIGVFPPVDESWFHEAYLEAALAWAASEDLESLEEAQSSLGWLYFFTGRDYNILSEDEMDRFMEHLRLYHGPGDASNALLAATIAARYRRSPTREQFALIKQPVLLMQGTDSSIPMMAAAEQHATFFVNSNPRLERIPGASLVFSVSERWAPEVNSRYASFLADQSFDPASVCTVDKTALRKALSIVADFENDPSITQKDPMAMWSYSRMTAEAAKEIKTLLLPSLALEHKTPIVPSGYHVRKYSERYDEEWLPPKVEQPRDTFGIVSRTTSEAVH